MPLYSEEIIEEVRSRNDIVDVISQYIRLEKKGRDYFGLCPFHNEKTGSFSVSPSKQIYYCFGCHAGGSVFNFVMEYDSLTYPEAIETLAERVGVNLPKREMTREEKQAADKRTLLMEISKETAGYFYKLLRSDHGKFAMDYFLGRQLSPDTMQKFGLGYSDKYPDDLYKYLRSKGYGDDILAESGVVTIDERKGGYDKFWNRAMFPIMDANGKVIAFGGRVMGEGEPKYLNSPETPIFNKSRTIYGLHLARKSRREQLILCEGYMDVISMHQAGFDNAVASLGTALTAGHAGILKRYAKDVYISYDSDGAGQNAALRAIPILKEAGINCKVIDMTPYKDPDEFMKGLGPQEYEKRIANAKNSFLFTVMMTKNKFDMSDPGARSEFQKTVAKMIVTEFDNDLERNNYTEAVASEFNIPIDGLKHYILELGRQGGIIKKTETGYEAHEPRGPKKQADGILKSMRLLLTWLCEEPRIFASVKPYVSPMDFEDGVYKRVAVEVFAQLEAEGKVNPPKILNMFTEDSDHRLVAEIFNTTVGEINTDEDLGKALKETLLRIKKHSLTVASASPESVGGFKGLLEGRKQLQNLEKAAFKI